MSDGRPLAIRHDVRDGVHLLALVGELSTGGDEVLLEQASSLLEQRGDRLVIDLSGVTFISSSGIGVLVRIAGQANVREQQVVLAQPAPFVAGVLETTKLTRFFEVRATVEEALAGLRGGSA